MPEYNAGDAKLQIVPDAREFKAKLEAELKKIHQTFNVQVEFQIAQARADMERFRAVQENNAIRVPVTANTDPARAEITKFRAEQRANPITIPVKTDMDSGGAAAARARAQITSQATDLGKEFSKAFSSALSGAQTLGIAGLVANVPAAVTGLASLTQAIQTLGQAGLALPGILAGAASSIGTLAIGVSGVVEAYQAVSAAAEESGTSQAERARAAASAATTLRNAIVDEAQAQRDVASARRDATAQLRDLNLELRGTAISEAEAQNNLKAAIRDLYTQPSKDAIDFEAKQLRVQRAQQSVAEAHNRTIDTQQKANEENAKGIEGSDQVVSANERLVRSQQQTVEAQRAVIEANTTVSATATKAQQEMAKLSPQAQEFVNTLIKLKPEFADLKKTVSGNLFEGLAGSFSSVVAKVLPNLKTGMGRISKALNDNFRTLFDTLGKEQNQTLLDRILGNTSVAQQKFSTAIDPLVRGIGTLTAAGTDMLPRIADAIGKVAERFANFIEAADKDGRLQKWMDEGLTGFANLGEILLNIGKSFVAVHDALGGGQGILGSLRTLTDRVATFLSSTEGQNKLKKFFEEGKEEINKLKPIVSNLIEIMPSIWQGAKAALDLILPPLQEFTEFLAENKTLVEGITFAFLAWKAIEPLVLGIKTAILLMNTALLGTPAAAAGSAAATTAAAGAAGGAATRGGLLGLASKVPAPVAGAAAAAVPVAGGLLVTAAIIDAIAGPSVANYQNDNDRRWGEFGQGLKEGMTADDVRNLAARIYEIPVEDLGDWVPDFSGKGEETKEKLEAEKARREADAAQSAALSGYAAGGPTDAGPAMLHDNEFVQRADAVKKYGLPFMTAINEGRIDPKALPHFQTGGLADMPMAPPPIPPPMPAPGGPVQFGPAVPQVPDITHGVGSGPAPGPAPTDVPTMPNLPVAQQQPQVQLPGIFGLGQQLSQGTPAYDASGQPVLDAAGNQTYQPIDIGANLRNAFMAPYMGGVTTDPQTGQPTGFDFGKLISSMPQHIQPQAIAAEFGSTLLGGVLGFFGLENSILSPSNIYNQAGQQVFGHFANLAMTSQGQPGQPGQPGAAGQPTAAVTGGPLIAAGQPLPVGVGSEGRLQVNTIAIDRGVSATFPMIKTIGGYREDPLPDHPSGQAIDVMLPPDAAQGTPKGVLLGSTIKDYAMANASAYGVDYVIWNSKMWYADGRVEDYHGDSPHTDHVHIHTTGGGYPTDTSTFLAPSGGITPVMFNDQGQLVYASTHGTASATAAGSTAVTPVSTVGGGSTASGPASGPTATGPQAITVDPASIPADQRLGPSGGGGSRRGPGASGRFPKDSVKGIVHDLMLKGGWPESEWSALDQLVQHESGWQPTAKNPGSTAYGLFQFLDATWATVGGQRTSDPALQAAYGLEYIHMRYGTPSEAWAFWQRQNPHWYETGGPTKAGPAILHDKEFVHQASAVDKYGLPFMNAINEGRLPRFDAGGLMTANPNWSWGPNQGPGYGSGLQLPDGTWLPGAQSGGPYQMAPGVGSGAGQNIWEWIKSRPPTPLPGMPGFQGASAKIPGFAVGGQFTLGVVPPPPPDPFEKSREIIANRLVPTPAMQSAVAVPSPMPRVPDAQQMVPPARPTPAPPSAPSAPPSQTRPQLPQVQVPPTMIRPAPVPQAPPGPEQRGQGPAPFAPTLESTSHNLPAVSTGIKSGAAAIGNIAQQAIGAAGGAFGGGAGAGAAGQFVNGLIQQGGKIVESAVNVVSSFLVGNVSMPSQYGAYGQTFRPQQAQAATAGSNNVVNYNGGMVVADPYEMRRELDLRDAQHFQSQLAHH